MPIPEGFDASQMKVYHAHRDEEPAEVDFEVDNGYISFAVDKLSAFIFAQAESDDSTGDHTGGNNTDEGNTGEGNTGGNHAGGNNTDLDRNDRDDDSNVGNHISSSKKTETATWIMDETGWWYRNADGTYPVNKWEYLTYNGKSDWYCFDENGYMKAGWYTDVDGKIYYLNPVSDGFKGAMVTGWAFIDGYWYYFNPVSDGYQGSMYVNTTNPDNFNVNEFGQWIVE